MCRLRLIAVSVFVCAVTAQSFAGTSFKATTTLTAETSNNTSAADTFAGEPNGNIAGANISKLPVRNLLYPGATAKIYAHVMPWFGFGGHVDVGYVSNDPAQVERQVSDMVSRGINGVIIDWYGRGEINSRDVLLDQAAQQFMQQAELHTGFSFAIMEDGGALKPCAATAGCSVTQTLIDDLNYVNAVYESSPAYLRFNGRPVIYFFGDAAFTIDWTRVRNSVAGNPLFIFRNNGGFTHTQSGGGFSWMATQSIFSPSTTDPASLSYLDSYYSTALAHSPMFSTGSAYKGFNDSVAAWNANRYIAQQCGQTWLKTMAEEGKYYSVNNQMYGIQIVTWNDYEEGTEIETGIDNCVTVSAAATGTTLSWSIRGQTNTLDHFNVYLSQDGEKLMWLASVPASQRSINLAQFNMNAGNYIAYVKAVAKPSLTNKMSGAVHVTLANQPPVVQLSLTPAVAYSPAAVTASSSGSSDPDGTIASSSLAFGDGTSAAGPTASHTYNSAGSYTVTATVTDNLGAISKTSGTVTVKAPEVIVSAPVSGASVSSPVQVTANGFSGRTVTAMQIYVDGTERYSIGSPTLNTSVTMTMGVHNLVVKGWDSLGRSFMKSLSLTVQNQPPQAAISVSSTSVLLGGSISASSAGSVDPDGSIVSRKIDFGDGAVATATSASHQYKQTGAFTIKTTVTDNLGASSTASRNVSIGNRYVAISSPLSTTSSTGVTAPSTTSSSVHVAGTGHSGYTVTAMQIYVDGALKWKATGATADAILPLSIGTHLIAVQGWDSSGVSFKSQFWISRK